MASQFSIQVKGLEKAAKELSPDIMRRPMRRFFEDSTDLVYKGVTRRISKVTREAVNSVKVEIDPSPVPLWGRVDSDLFRMRMLEYGTGPHRPPVTPEFEAWARRRRRNPWAVARSIELHGTRGRKMFSKTKRGTRRKTFKLMRRAAKEIAAQI